MKNFLLNKDNFSGYYINLDSAASRREHMESMLERFDFKKLFKRFSGIQPKSSIGTLSIGESGCLLSHINILKIEENSNKLLGVVEDDVMMNDKFINNLSNSIGMINGEWDIIFLCHTEPINNIQRIYTLMKLMHENNLIIGNDKRLIIDANEWYMYGTVGYVINANSKSKLINGIEGFLNQNPSLPIDEIINRLARANIINAKMVLPYLIGVNIDLSSQMLNRKNSQFDLLHSFIINLFYEGRNNNDLVDWISLISKEDVSSLETRVVGQIYSNFLFHSIRS